MPETTMEEVHQKLGQGKLAVTARVLSEFDPICVPYIQLFTVIDFSYT